MKRQRRLIAILAMLVLALGVSACGGDDDDDGGGEPSDAAARWEGRFASTFGEVTFRAEGDDVTGSYDYCGGELEGTASGDRLTGEWTEDPAACEPNERRGGETESEGTFDFTLAPNDGAFTGQWRYASGVRDSAGDQWEGRRLSD
jgi:hypothetical protein